MRRSRSDWARRSGANQKIPTNAWNTILSRAEASVFQASEA
jgi:hypothetical protein